MLKDAFLPNFYFQDFMQSLKFKILNMWLKANNIYLFVKRRQVDQHKRLSILSQVCPS